MQRRKEERAEVENTKSSDFVDRVDEIEGCGGWKKRLKRRKLEPNLGQMRHMEEQRREEERREEVE